MKLARSNLQLALANNEMLEEALKRDSVGGGKDVGWRRWSEHPDQRRVSNTSKSSRGTTKEGSIDGSERSPRVSQGTHDRTTSVPSSDSSAPTSPSHPTESTSTTTLTATVSTQSTSSFVSATSAISTSSVPPSATPPPEGSRFFRFRFGSGASSPNPNVANTATGTSSAAPSRPQSPVARIRSDASHLMSASLPSLVSNANHREEELTTQLEAERKKYQDLLQEKGKLEGEIETLSQALFEEVRLITSPDNMFELMWFSSCRPIRWSRRNASSVLT